ncbi:hypothetical protein AGMMS50230_05540 [Spirochaetia bacterium]|nr:hypothetical protein AGMMS50230_05540 [Spirochaetia bacterium]
MPDTAQNPYESPQAEANTVTPLAAQQLTENMLFHLRGTSPWLRFVGITGIIVIGIMVLALLVLAVAFRSMITGIEGLDELTAISPFLLLIYIPFLVIPFIQSLFTFLFGKKLRSYQLTGDTVELEQAFKHNKSLWTLNGIMYIIGLIGFGFMLIIGVIAVAAAATRQF